MGKINIKLALVDDDRLVLQLLKNHLKQEPTLDVIHTANGGETFIDVIRIQEELVPDIVLLDLRMKNGDGLNTADVLKEEFPEVKIIILSSHYNLSTIGFMVKKGISAFIPKETDKEDLIRLIYEVYNKGFYFTEEQIEQLRGQISHKAPKIHLYTEESLSIRELDVLRLICLQYTAKQIADKLFISSKTVEVHKSNLLLKTGVKNTSGLIIYAIQKKLIDPDQIPLIPG